VHLDTATPGARVCDPQQCPNSESPGKEYGCLDSTAPLRLTEPRSVAVSRCARDEVTSLKFLPFLKRKSETRHLVSYFFNSDSSNGYNTVYTHARTTYVRAPSAKRTMPQVSKQKQKSKIIWATIHRNPNRSRRHRNNPRTAPPTRKRSRPWPPSRRLRRSNDPTRRSERRRIVTGTGVAVSLISFRPARALVAATSGRQSG